LSIQTLIVACGFLLNALVAVASFTFGYGRLSQRVTQVERVANINAETIRDDRTARDKQLFELIRVVGKLEGKLDALILLEQNRKVG